MARAELLGDGGVILAALVGVADQQRDGGAGGAAFVDAGQNLDVVGFATRRSTCPGTAC